MPGYFELRRLVDSPIDVYPTALALALALASSYTASTSLVVLKGLCDILRELAMEILVRVFENLHLIAAASFVTFCVFDYTFVRHKT